MSSERKSWKTANACKPYCLIMGWMFPLDQGGVEYIVHSMMTEQRLLQLAQQVSSVTPAESGEIVSPSS